MNIEYSQEQLELRGKLEAANINPDSFLATDYLNHFNEILMLIEMVPDMPDMLDECFEWKPKSYPDHFMDSGFTAKELAVKAYEISPKYARLSFDRIIKDLDEIILGTLHGLKVVGASDRGFSPEARLLIQSRTATMQDLLAKMNRIIHGHLEEDVIQIVTEEPVNDSEELQSQEDIDALFD